MTDMESIDREHLLHYMQSNVKQNSKAIGC